MKNVRLAFKQKVLDKLKEIPRGMVTTYGLLADAIGSHGSARAVGRAVGSNHEAPVVPCHRVVRADGKIGGYSATGGVKRKIKLLKEEGLVVRAGKIENLSDKLFIFKPSQAKLIKPRLKA